MLFRSVGSYVEVEPDDVTVTDSNFDVEVVNMDGDLAIDTDAQTRRNTPSAMHDTTSDADTTPSEADRRRSSVDRKSVV